MVLLLMLLAMGVKPAMAQTHVWRDIYEAKKKDTIYGIARMYDITVDELMDANPDMKAADYKLKKGAMVFIPKSKPAQAVANEATVAKTGQALRVGVMLPLHDADGDGKRMVEYYRGILMACDSLRRAGISTDLHAWNVDATADIRTVLLNGAAKQLDIVFGPLYSSQVKPLADFCRNNSIKLVIPFSITANDVDTNPQVYQVYQDANQLNEKAILSFIERFRGCNPVFIDCNDTTSRKGIFTFGLRKRLEQLGISYQITNLNSSLQMFAKAFSTAKKNVVILNTGRSQELNLAFRRLNQLTEQVPSLQISMFGYNEWLLYESVYRQLYHKYDVYVPSYYYYYKGLAKIASLENAYKQWFGVETQNSYLPRFAITGYDHAQFFLRGLHERGNTFNATAQESTYKPLQTPLRFQRALTGGGMRNAAFKLVHYNSNMVIDTISY